MYYCKECGKVISHDEFALTKKIVARNATEYYCYECLAEAFKTTPERLKDMVVHFKERGCMLF